MDDHWQQISTWFERIRDLPAEERTGMLEREQVDAEVRSQVLALVAADEQGGSRFEPSEGYRQALGGGVAAQADESEAGQTVGPYRLDELLGRGGMGTVWMAHRQDQAFEQKVAVKIVRRGLDTDEVVRRFQLERQVLANLEHPGIARLIDGGATGDGRPYMVLECVDGLPIDVWCEQHELSTRQRIELFRSVCEVVSRAHQGLVVHRDLKPSNILVTPDGHPKLLDFGIAKLLDPAEPGITSTLSAGPGLMTPEYASPEQVLGKPVSTSTDVYSLGVVLYQLLCGRLPYAFETRTAEQITKTVRDTIPPRPSSLVDRAALRRELAGDLDTIVQKALAKEPERRYASVEQFSEDLLRHLQGFQVRARPDSLGYRIQRFTQRNRVATLAVLLVVLVSIAAAVVSARFAWKARRSEAAERQRAEGIRGIAHDLMFGVYEQIARLPGAVAARRQVVATALAYLDELAREARGDPRLLREVAQGYSRLADVQGHPSQPSLRDLEAAFSSLEMARTALDAARTLAPDDARTLHQSAALRLQRADFEIGAGRATDGLETARIALLEARGLEVPDLHLAVQARTAQGNAYARLGRDDAALAEYEDTLAGLDAAAPEADDSDRALRQVHILENKIGDLLVRRNDLEDAEQRFRAALSLADELLSRSPDNIRARRDRSVTIARIAQIYLKRGDHDDAGEWFGRALEAAEDCVALDPQDASSLFDLATARSHMAATHHGAGEFDAARRMLDSSLETLRELSRRDPDHQLIRLHLAVETTRMGEIERDSGDALRAAVHFDTAIEQLRQLDAENPASSEVDFRLALNLDFLGSLRLAAGALNEALELFEEYHQQAVSSVKLYPGDIRHRQQVAIAEDRLGMVHQALGGEEFLPLEARLTHYEEALLWYQRCLDSDAGFVRDGLPIDMGAATRSLIEAELPVIEQALERLRDHDS